MVIILMVYMIFGSTLEECQTCSWPYTSGVNSNGKCYPTYQGFQTGLSVSCAAYCNTWQSQGDTQQTTYSVKKFIAPSSGSAPYCECIRLNRGGFVSTKVRPQSNCDWGYSDDLQSYYDSISVSSRYNSTSNIKNQYTPSSDTSLYNWWNDINEFCVEASNTSGYSCYSGGCYSAPGVGDVWLLNHANYGDGYSYHSLPSGHTCADYYSGKMSMTNNSPVFRKILDNQMSSDSSISRLDAGINALKQSVNATQEGILSALAASDSTLLARMNNIGGGGGTDIDLGPVVNSIDSSTRAIEKQNDRNALFDYLADSIYHAKGFDTTSDDLALGDTAGYMENIIQTYFSQNKGAIPSDSAFIANVAPVSTCTEFPSDPEIEFSILGPDKKIKFELSKFSFVMNLVKTLLYIASWVFSAAMIFFSGKWALDILGFNIGEGK